jgi:hypothetical protein
VRVFTFYSLRPETDVEAFKEWSRTVDKPGCLAKPVCNRFDVFVADGGNGAQMPFVVEDIDVDSWDGWQEAINAPDHADLGKQFEEFVLIDTLVSVHCSEA